MRLTVSMAQIRVVRGDPGRNLARGEELAAEAARRGSDLVCFPEMWTTGFDGPANERLAAAHEAVVEQVADMARRHRIWISGSMPTLNAQGRVADTHILFDAAGGRAAVYRKTHLFTLHHEERHMVAGDALCVAETPWGPVGLSVCYDIRFPEVFRSYALMGTRLVLSPMAFPHPRLAHWKTLVRARAIENQMFMVGTNQVGSEDLGAAGVVTYFGDSTIVDPWGETVAEASEEGEDLLTAAIDLDMADEVRARMSVLRDRRPELYRLG